MARMASLAGTVTLGGGTLRVTAAMGDSGTGMAPLRGHLVAGVIDFETLVGELLDEERSPLLADFPQLRFAEASIAVVPEQGASLQAECAGRWRHPLGKLRGVTMESFELQARLDRENPPAIALASAVRFGEVQGLRGFIELYPGSQQVVGFRWHGRWPVAELLDAFEAEVPWGQLPDLVLLPRTPERPIRLYHAIASVNGYRQGLSLDQCDVELFGQRVEVFAQLRMGIEIGGQLPEPVELGSFLRLSDPGFEDRGPELVAACHLERQAFELRAGCHFFGTPLGTAAIGVQRAENGRGVELRATVTHRGQILGITDPTITFLWNHRDGLRIRDWPLDGFPGPSLDILGFMQSAGRLDCGSLVDFVFDRAFTTTFDVLVGFEITETGAPAITIGGTYTIRVAGKKELIAVTIPTIPVAIERPDELDFAGLVRALRDTLAGAGDALIQALLDDPETLSKFLIAVVGKELVHKFASVLICNGWKLAVPTPSPVTKILPV